MICQLVASLSCPALVSGQAVPRFQPQQWNVNLLVGCRRVRTFAVFVPSGQLGAHCANRKDRRGFYHRDD